MSAAWTVAFVLLAVTVVTLAVVVLGLGYRVSKALEGAEALLRGLEFFTAPGLGGLVGSVAPPLAGLRESDRSVNTPAGDIRLVLFVDRDCGPCKTLTDELFRSRWQPADAELIVVVDDPATRFLGLDAWTVLQDGDQAIKSAWQIIGTPAAYVIDGDGMVTAFRIANTLRELRNLVDEAQLHRHSHVDTVSTTRR